MDAPQTPKIAGRTHERWARARQILLPVLLLGAAAFFASFVHRFYPIQQWLFWRYAGYWLLCGLWSAACVSAGHLTLKLVVGRPLPIVEHLVTSFAIGVFEFAFLMSVAGLLKLYGPALFVLLPLMMLGAGFVPLRRYLARVVRHVRHGRRRAPPPPAWTYAVLALGLLGAGMVYFVILTPENVQFDSRWKHLALAEEYAVTGGVRRFPEGWTVETYPHLATFVYSWAFLLPGGIVFDKVELAAHMEYVGFLSTLAAIPAAVRLMIPRGLGPYALRLSWAARFLFPGIFLYDSSLSVGGDHIASIFALPAFTLLIRAYRELSPRFIALLIMVLAGAGLTKYTGAVILVPFPALFLGARTLVLAYRSLRGKVDPAIRKNWYLGPLVAVAAGLFFTSTHWAKNLVYYGDPLYPTLYKYLSLRPWTPDAANIFEWGYKDYQFWRPDRNLDGVLRTLRALVDFSFIPNDYPRYHGKVPTFGSLYTLLLLCLPFLKGTRRIWLLVGYVQVALLCWYWTHHQDRYLQAIVPYMAAATAATIALLWRAASESRLATLATRTSLGTLVGLQVVWSGDIYFIPGHAMVKSPIKAVVDLLGQGYAKRYTQRFNIYPTFQSISRALPEGARVLLHDNHNHLGIGAETLSDWNGWQYGISYGRLRTPREVWDLLKGMGVTHVAWDTQVSKGWDTVAGDLMFFDFALKRTVKHSKHRGMTLAEMGPAPDPDTPFPTTVAYLGCGNAYKSGLYELSDLTVPVFGPNNRAFPAPRVSGPPGGASAAELLKQAAFAVVDPKCHPSLPADKRDFMLAARRRVLLGGKGKLDLYVRKGGGPSTPAAAKPPAPTPAAAEDPVAPGEEEDLSNEEEEDLSNENER
ncbi:hypothetical protein WMF31_01240 [Sorangium sp. So ce1036]|uniref:hypothetical protein n=1 Tax=Sorangium sp. So ce1036 TaxID=3133328 RepID=UPI003F0F69BE